jgi:hypothetical protein
VIALAGSTVNMVQGGVFMIHNAMFQTGGNAAQLDAKSKLVKGLSDTMRNIYVARTGIPKDIMQGMMDKETHLTAKEAQKMGFVDNVTKALKAVAIIDTNNMNDLLDKIKKAGAALGAYEMPEAQEEIDTLAHIAAVKAQDEVKEKVLATDNAAEAITAELVSGEEFIAFKAQVLEFMQSVAEFIEVTPTEEKRKEEILEASSASLTSLLAAMKSKVSVPVATGTTATERVDGGDVFAPNAAAKAIQAGEDSYQRLIQKNLNN